MAGALGAALTQMVAGLTVGRKAYATVTDEAQGALRKSEELRQALTDAITADMQAFDALIRARRDKSLDAAGRQAAIEEATFRAAEVPLEVARLARNVAELAQTIATIGNCHAVADAIAGAILAQAAVQIALLNIKISLVNMNKGAREASATAAACLREADNLYADTRKTVEAVTGKDMFSRGTT